MTIDTKRLRELLADFPKTVPLHPHELKELLDLAERYEAAPEG